MLNNVKVGTKLIAGFMVTAGLAVFIGIMGIMSVNKVNSIVDTMYSRNLANVRLAKQLDIILTKMRLSVRSSVLAANERERNEQIQRFYDYKGAFTAVLDSLKTASSTGKEKEQIKNIEDNWDKYLAECVNMIEAGKRVNLKVPKELTKAYGDGTSFISLIENSTVELGRLNEAMALDEWKESVETYCGVRNTLAALLITAAALGILLGVYLSRSISGPLKAAEKMIHELSRGHLDMRLKMNRTDEIGVMAGAMDSFADNLQHTVVASMKKISEGDLSAVVSLSDERDEISKALKQTVDSLKSLIIEDGGMVLHGAAQRDLSQRLKRE